MKKYSLSVLILLLASLSIFTGQVNAADTTMKDAHGTLLRNHLGRWTRILGNVSGLVRNLQSTEAEVSGAKEIHITFGACAMPETWTNAVITGGNAREIAIQYLRTGTTYCYSAQPYRNGQTVGKKRTGQITIPDLPLLNTHTQTNPVLGVMNSQGSSNASVGRSAPMRDSTNLSVTGTPLMPQEMITVTNHMGVKVRSPKNWVSGLVKWGELMNKLMGHKVTDATIYYKECTASQWQNATIVPGSLRQTLLRYLKPGVSYCYKVTVKTDDKREVTREGRVTLPVIIPTIIPRQPPIVCTTDTLECLDGTTVRRVGPSCNFAPCPPRGL